MTNTLNRAEETTDKTGTGASVNLLGATSGRSTFAVAASIQGVTGNVYATIETDDGTIWETGIYTLGSGVLTRVSVLATSLGNTAPIDFPVGSHKVFSAQPNQALVAAGDVVGRIAANQIHTITGGSFGNLSVDAANFNLFAANTRFQGAGTIRINSDTLGSGSATIDVSGASSQISLNANEDSSGNTATVELTGTYAELSNYNGTTTTSARAGSNLFQVHVGANQRIRADTVGVGLSSNVPNEAATVGGALSLQTMAAPSATAGHGKIYVKTSDGLPYYKDPAGVETAVLGGGLPYVTGPTVLGRVTGTGAAEELTPANARNVVGLSEGSTFDLTFTGDSSTEWGLPGIYVQSSVTIRQFLANELWLVPFIAQENFSITDVFAELTTVEAASSVIFSLHQGAKLPGTAPTVGALLQSTAALDSSATGILSVAGLNWPISRGQLYWLGMATTHTLSVRVRICQLPSESRLWRIIGATNNFVVRVEKFVIASAYPPASNPGVPVAKSAITTASGFCVPFAAKWGPTP